MLATLKHKRLVWGPSSHMWLNKLLLIQECVTFHHSSKAANLYEAISRPSSGPPWGHFPSRAMLLWTMEKFSLNPGHSKRTFWYTDLYTVRLEVYFCFFTLFCSTAFIITNTVPREPGLWVGVKAAGGWLPTWNLWPASVRSIVPQRLRYTWSWMCFLILKQTSNCVPLAGWGGVGGTPGTTSGREEGWGGHFRYPLPILHHRAVLRAITLEKSPIRSLGSLSKIFSMVPFGEDTRHKDWCRICNKSKVENEARLLNRTYENIHLEYVRKKRVKC